ncbi:hypothetical protein PG993_011292 [Apiospora rasikravindrae]|uniref:Uncharacterized protein n=1 Tax=Apiospora rasikravindrae TaxID=990691 RepID=A0ABR1SE35_9PEZI
MTPTSAPSTATATTATSSAARAEPPLARDLTLPEAQLGRTRAQNRTQTRARGRQGRTGRAGRATSSRLANQDLWEVNRVDPNESSSSDSDDIPARL